MLEESLKAHVDSAWDALWSQGVTNPISVVDVIGTLLMCGATENAACWGSLNTAVQAEDETEIARLIKEVRNSYGIQSGAEIESPDFWRGSHGLSGAMMNLSFLRGQTEKADLLGDIYEHVLSKLSLAGQFGQFRTPRHVVDFMVELVGLREGDNVVDPSCGSGGFLVAASDFAKEAGIEISVVGSEIDRTIARIAQANIAFHSVARGLVEAKDGLAKGKVEVLADVILANPPFSGTVSDATAAAYQIRTKKTELLFLEAILDRLKPRGRAAVVVPLGVLTGRGAAFKLRKRLLGERALHAVIELPVGVFRPYTDIRTAILFIDKSRYSESITMVRVDNDGYSLNHKRSVLSANDLPKALELLKTGSGRVEHVQVNPETLEEGALSLVPSRYLTPLDLDDKKVIARPEALSFLQSRLNSLSSSKPDLSRILDSSPTALRPLESLVTVIRQPAEPWDISSDTRVVLLEHVEKDTGLYSSVDAQSIETKSNKLRFRPGDIVFSKLRPNLRKCFVAEESGVASSDSIVLRPIEPDCSYLLAALLRSKRVSMKLGRFVAGGNLPRISSKDLLSLEIPWPSEPQDRIALDAASSAVIAVRKDCLALISDVAEYERALLNELGEL